LKPEARGAAPSVTHVLLLIAFVLALAPPGLATLPATDRDEARFAQATKQMLETGDYLRIRFQDAPRHKKPPGIHWMQAGSVRVCEWITGRADARESIWPYRIPSALGALISVVALYVLFTPVVGRTAAMYSAIMLAASWLLIIEAHIATTDAMLCAAMTLAMGTFARIHSTAKNESDRLRFGFTNGSGTVARASRPSDQTVETTVPPVMKESPTRTRRAQLGLALFFWLAVSVGVLIKGPMAIIVPGVAIITLCIVERSLDSMRRLRPLIGTALLIGLSAAWMIPVYRATEGAFFRDAFLGDFAPKIASGVESHGFPPGFYLVLLVVTFWPGSLIAASALMNSWKSRRATSNEAHRSMLRFLFAWLVPMWIVLELVPTKLPHYVLPLYPALAVICGIFAARVFQTDNESVSRPDSGARFGFVFWGALTAALGMGLAFVIRGFGGALSAWSIAALGGIAIAAIGPAWLAWEGRFRRAIIVASVASILFWGSTLHVVLPGLTPLWPSRTIVGAMRDLASDTDADATSFDASNLIAVDYHEPSLVFYAGTHIRLRSARHAAAEAIEEPASVIVITERRRETLFNELEALGHTAEVARSFRAFNYSKGEWLTLHIVHRVRPTSRFAAHPPSS